MTLAATWLRGPDLNRRPSGYELRPAVLAAAFRRFGVVFASGQGAFRPCSLHRFHPLLSHSGSESGSTTARILSRSYKFRWSRELQNGVCAVSHQSTLCLTLAFSARNSIPTFHSSTSNLDLCIPSHYQLLNIRKHTPHKQSIPQNSHSLRLGI